MDDIIKTKNIAVRKEIFNIIFPIIQLYLLLFFFSGFEFEKFMIIR